MVIKLSLFVISLVTSGIKLKHGYGSHSIYNFVFITVINKTEQNRNDKKRDKTGIAAKKFANHGERVTAIILWFIAASSSWRFSVIAVKQALGTRSSTLRVKN